jgi:hypothetical protein
MRKRQKPVRGRLCASWRPRPDVSTGFELVVAFLLFRSFPEEKELYTDIYWKETPKFIRGVEIATSVVT